MAKLEKIKGLLVLLLFFLGVSSVKSQQPEAKLQMVDFAEAEFVPHWQLGVQGGVAADLGEAPLAKLLSPALQVTAEYRFLPFLGIRGAISGFWAKNRYVFPKKDYSWNFIQPSIEAKIDLTSLIMGWVPNQPVSTYIFGGIGTAITYGNEDAEKAKKQFGQIAKPEEFSKLWKDSRFNPAFRAGMGFDIYLNDYLQLNGEVNANLLPDHFNSKLGKHDNKDWHFNALVGLKINLGKTYRGNEPVLRSVRTIVNKEPIVRDTAALSVNIQFLINSSQLRSSEFGKLHQLIYYLNAHPKSHIEMTGYADRLTGTPTINERLSRERAAVVAQWLIRQGVDSRRIYTDAKGDRVQPFPVNEDNRVTICYVVDILQ